MTTLRSVEDRIRIRVAVVENRRRSRRRRPSAWLVLTLLAILALLVVLPILLVLLNAFKSEADYSAHGALALPAKLDFSGIVLYLETVDYGQKLLNSLIMSTSVATGAVVLSLVTAYALGIGRVRGRISILAVLLIANILPQEALIYPLFSGVQKLNASDSLLPVIVILIVLNTSFGTYLLTSVLGTFPRALLEAAQVDGAGRWRILWRVVVPVLRPTLTVLFIFVFIWSWNEFLIPIVFLTSTDTQTIPIALATLQGDRFLSPTMMAAGSLVSLLPTLIVFLVFQRSLVRGVTVGSIR
jgi:raffinose/stachyose/melibiose transport system permease protein